MTIEEVKTRLKKIKEVKDDYEHAHILEDRLFHDFVKAIIEFSYQSKENIIQLAQEVYKSRDIEFTRWVC